MQDTSLAVTFNALLSKGTDSLRLGVAKALFRDDMSLALKEANAEYANRGARDLDVALTYAILLTHRELTEEAIGVLKKAIEYHSHNAALQLAQIDLLLARGDMEAAKDLTEALSNVSFNEPRHIAYLGDAYLSMNMLPEALAAFTSALDLGLNDAMVASNAAQLLAEQGDVVGCAEMYERAGRIAAINPEYYLRAADAWLDADVNDRAILAYRRVVKMMPDNAHAWTFLGFAYRESDELEDSLEAFQRAYKLEPDDMESLLNVAHALLEVGQSEEARRFYEMASIRDPEEVEAVNGMVAAAFELGDIEMAEQLGRRAVAMNPENPDNQYNLGVILLSINRNTDAETHFQAALDLSPDEPRYAIALAQILLRKGETEEAMKSAALVTQTIVGDATGIFEFSRDLVRLGGADRVLEFINAVETFDPRWKPVKSIIEYLAHGLRREDSAYAACLDEFRAAVEASPEIIPVMWDFEEIERLALGIEPDQKKTLEIMIAVLEGRRDLKHLDRVGK